MNIEQKQYKEMFEEVRLSDDKKAKLEEAMRMEIGRKRGFSFKRFAVLATCAVTMLSCVCIAGAQVSKAMKEKSIEEMLEEKGDVITNEPRGEKIPNKVTPETKEVTILVSLVIKEITQHATIIKVATTHTINFLDLNLLSVILLYL